MQNYGVINDASESDDGDGLHDSLDDASGVPDSGIGSSSERAAYVSVALMNLQRLE